MPLTQSHLVRWTLPAFALILGLFWYKRRYRADPGGADEPKKKSTSPDKMSSPKLPNSNLCDSGIHTDESFNNLNISTTVSPPEELITCSPRKVSESLAIPRKSPSVEVRTPWHEDEDIDSQIVAQLGSNPSATSNSFDFRAKSSSYKRRNNSVRSQDVIEKHSFVDEEAIVQELDIAEKKNLDESIKDCDDNKVTSEACSTSEQQQQATCERDSANHSPCSGVLEESVPDEARSEGSTDSGKGGSIKGIAKGGNKHIYEFSVNIKYVGKLIGKGGHFLHTIRSASGVNISIKRHPERDYKLCSIIGSPEAISIALDIIRQNFPEKTYPNFSLEPLVDFYKMPTETDETQWVSELSQLSLIESVNNDVVVCSVIRPDHYFVQIPTHPTYPMLRILDEKMTEFYDSVESPTAPEELWKGMILVARWYDKWVRVLIENPDPKGEATLVRLVDHGGYWNFSNAEMRKIHSDFLSLPFQAVEVFLANIQPKHGEWSQEAYDIIAQICNGVIGQAQIEGYIDSSTFISLYYNIQNHGVISIADELIARDLAEPAPFHEAVALAALPVA